ncbi:MAG: MFS transporter [Bdellovibrionaceae bacterium]|nr:MFS transporter [Pseudobdellovibrionaceae bacterium]
MPLCYLLAPGNLFLTALLTQIFGFGESEFSWLAALPFCGNVLQAAVMAWLSHRFAARTLALAGAWLNLGVWLGFTLALPWIPRHDPTAALLPLMAVFGLLAVFFSISAVAWQAWLVEWLPQRVRGRYFGRRNFCINLVMTMILVSGAEVLRVTEKSLTGYQILFGSVALLRAWGLMFMHRQHSPPHPAGTHQDVPLRQSLAAVFAQRPLLWFLAFNTAIGFLMNTTYPFLAIFMLEHLDYTVGEVTCLVVIATAIGALAVPIHGRWADRWGHRHVLVLCFLGWELSNLVWPFMRPGPLKTLQPLVWYIGGFCSSGFLICQLSLLLRLAPACGQIDGGEHEHRGHLGGGDSGHFVVRAVSGPFHGGKHGSDRGVSFGVLVQVGLHVCRTAVDPRGAGAQTGGCGLPGGGIAHLAADGGRAVRAGLQLSGRTDPPVGGRPRRQRASVSPKP